MFTLENLCDVLKDQMGVKEVVLEIEGDIPTIEIDGEYEGTLYKIKATNADFAEHGI